MLVRRLLAVLIAVGLVLAAAAARSRLVGEDAPPVADDDLRVVCVRELAPVCDAVTTATPPVVEDAETTAERFAERDPGVDVWLTLAPWPDLAAARRAQGGLPEVAAASSPVLARSPALVVARRDRLRALEPTCDGGGLTWRCLGDAAGRPWADFGGDQAWGRVKVGLDHPERSAEGLLALSQATSDFFDDQEWTSRSLSSTDYFSWLSGLGAAVEQTAGQTPLERMLLTGGADYEFAGALEATAIPLLRSAPQRAAQLMVHAVDPVVTADVVVVGYGEAGTPTVDAVAAQIEGALADAGWRFGGAPPPSESRIPALPGDNGLPSAAALEALRQLWIEVARG
ncbi:MAG TPA: hypothetical protein VK923_05025 [Euzebyales bacterium]|nr:hypothetical protein [Euzebyales bacterium]